MDIPRGMAVAVLTPRELPGAGALELRRAVVSALRDHGWDLVVVLDSVPGCDRPCIIKRAAELRVERLLLLSREGPEAVAPITWTAQIIPPTSGGEVWRRSEPCHRTRPDACAGALLASAPRPEPAPAELAGEIVPDSPTEEPAQSRVSYPDTGIHFGVGPFILLSESAKLSASFNIGVDHRFGPVSLGGVLQLNPGRSIARDGSAEAEYDLSQTLFGPKVMLRLFPDARSLTPFVQVSGGVAFRQAGYAKTRSREDEVIQGRQFTGWAQPSAGVVIFPSSSASIFLEGGYLFIPGVRVSAPPGSSNPGEGLLAPAGGVVTQLGARFQF
ncbi:MAG: hypothetical protein GMKNLPBB_02467 [Myxococcota bacterium]|nr:hypothetical protein [Myxococcota bacterium]